MRLFNYIVKYLTYPLWMIKDGKFNLYRYVLEYRNYNSLDPEKIRQKQEKNLEKLIKHAYLNTTYYKTLFNKNSVSYNDLSNPASAIRKIPVLTKKLIRENNDDIIAKNIAMDRLTKDSTGGSTGTPLSFYRDKECFLKRKAQELFFDKWIGYEIGDKVAFFVAARHHPKGSKKIKYLLRNMTCDRVLAFDPYRTDREYLEYFLKLIRSFKPEVIKCFPNSLYIFAKFLKERGIDDITPRAVSCTGETLHGYQRELFEEVFQCPVFEKYGSFEAGVAACECSEHNGMHMFPDGVFFEFINSEEKPARPGEMAQLVITDLFNYGFPLIRYQIGDVGIYSDKRCSCGSPLPLITNLYGRDRDILVDQNENPKPGYLFVEVFNKNNIPGQFQVVQAKHNHVLVRAVKKAGYSKSHEKLIFDKFHMLLGSKIQIDIEYVNKIPREPSGKYRYVHSMISPFK